MSSTNLLTKESRAQMATLNPKKTDLKPKKPQVKLQLPKELKWTK
jgi:hypothetical protein